MKVVDKGAGDVTVLVDSFFVNDPYYPRPRPEDELYCAFRRQYMDACPQEHGARAALFLLAIEHRQRETDLKRQAVPQV